MKESDSVLPLNVSEFCWQEGKMWKIRGGQLHAIWPKKSLPLELKITLMTKKKIIIKKMEGQMASKLQKWYQPQSCCVVDYQAVYWQGDPLCCCYNVLNVDPWAKHDAALCWVYS